MVAGRPQLVLLDANVFVSAVKDARKATATFRLIVHLLSRDDIRLVGSEILAKEYLRYAEAFPSPTAAALISAILEKMEIVRVEDRFILACAPHFPLTEAADCIHAATCHQTGAVLVSNDRHFKSLHAAGVIELATIAEAILRWVPTERR